MKFLFLNKRFIGLVALFTFSVAIMPLRVMALPSGALSILSQAERQAQVDKILDALSGPQAKPHLVMIGMDLEELETKLGKNVDLITYRSVHHLLRDIIFREQVQIL